MSKNTDAAPSQHLMEELAQVKQERNEALEALKTAINRIENIIPMLGPKAQKVTKAWAESGQLYLHVDYGPEGAATQGEDRAQVHLDMIDAMKTSKPIGVAELDRVLPKRVHVSELESLADHTKREG